MFFHKVTKALLDSLILIFSLQISLSASKYIYSTVQIFRVSYYSNAAPIVFTDLQN